MRGLYLHIPFCKQKCHYCNFVISLNKTPAYRRRFLDALDREIIHTQSVYGNLSFDTFYIGGGTPSLLTTDELREIIEKVRKHFTFIDSVELTCEFNPGDCDANKINAYAKLGINRVSLGAQAFQSHLLHLANRTHQVSDTEQTVRWLTDAGIENISLDLIMGLPQQNLQDFEESLRQCIRLNAKQVSLYDLEIHRETRWGIDTQAGRLPLPSDDFRGSLFRSAIELFHASGYDQYEISTFAQPGYESKHNLIYWANQEYLGLGPGAFSYLNGVRYQFALTSDQYLRKCEAEDWKNAIEDKLSDEKKEIETLLTGLRRKNGIDLSAFSLISQPLEKILKEPEAAELLIQEKTMLCLSPKGKFLAETTFGWLATNLIKTNSRE